MARTRKSKPKSFRELLESYMKIRGLDIVIVLEDGREIELHKNRKLEEDAIVVHDKVLGELRIPISSIRSVDLYAA